MPRPSVRLKPMPPRIIVLTALVAACALLGCSKEKATALKTVAEAARTRSTAALRATQTLLERSVAMPSEAREKRAAALAGQLATATTINAELLDQAMTAVEVDRSALKHIEGEFEPLFLKTRAFGAMFRSLPEGSYFSADAVKKAEAHAIQLSVEYMHFAKTLHAMDALFAGERTLLLESLQRAKTLPTEARGELLRKYAADALALREAELQAKQAAIGECLLAAEAFRATAELIRGYSKLSAGDMLTMTRELLATANDISGQQADVARLVERYGAVEKSIRDDAQWSAALSLILNP
jgi:hypothetical protein